MSCVKVCSMWASTKWCVATRICSKRSNRNCPDGSPNDGNCYFFSIWKISDELRWSIWIHSRNHPLSKHSDILTCIETRMSMLSMTYTKYIEVNLCCFIPGKVCITKSATFPFDEWKQIEINSIFSNLGHWRSVARVEHRFVQRSFQRGTGNKISFLRKTIAYPWSITGIAWHLIDGHRPFRRENRSDTEKGLLWIAVAFNTQYIVHTISMWVRTQRHSGASAVSHQSK